MAHDLEVLVLRAEEDDLGVVLHVDGVTRRPVEDVAAGDIGRPRRRRR